MFKIPSLNLTSIRPPAGLPSSHTSRSARLRHYVDAQQGTAFGDSGRSRPKRHVALSHREVLEVNADKQKYANWLTKWDRDPGVARFLMCSDFVKQCKGMSHAQLDELFGNSSELVFIHMYAFLRMNYSRACSIALQLEALRIFFDASSGYCFAHHFLSSGGTALLLELVKMQDDLSNEDMKSIMETFLSLTAHGPKAQQLMTETKIVEVFTDEIPKFRDKEIHQMTVMLFAQIAEGDEQHSEAFCNAFRAEFVVYAAKSIEALTTAAHIFRILLTPSIAAEWDIKNTISDFLVLTNSSSLDVQHEGIAIFQALLDNAVPVRRKFLFDVVIDLMSVNTDEVVAEMLDQRLLQQTFAVRLLQAILHKKNGTSEAVYGLIQKFLPALVRAIGNTENFASQKAACLVLAQMVLLWPDVRTFLSNAMPKEWVNDLLTNPQNFCLELTPTQVDTFTAAEPSNFFFDLPQDEAAAEATKHIEPTEARRATQISVKDQTSLVKRPTALRFIPSSKPIIPKPQSRN